MKITSTETLVKALRILAVDIESEDGATIAEGAERIDELAAIATEMADMISCDRPLLTEGCKACAIRNRLYDLGVMLLP
ncbi:hypothetical protein KC887_09205 [Candidatus Kaiserbacteria bacterium]|nr:hypothetical protein [Candidatus Kaiserbacteria bacterium]